MAEEKKIYSSFEELKTACINFVKSSKERGAYTGLKKLLTELYPDKAHFVYELLQNAEDQGATEVKFVLENSRLMFMHNGKRDFSLTDIDSITNIGNSTKRDDPTSIGKFGVGFKAVYAYTNTPEIHSGEYDFKIIDMLIPENIGVEKCAKKGITEFVFPFDNPNKPADKAVYEISETLRSLDETSIIFLRSIKQISYTLPNNDKGRISVVSNLSDKKFIYAIDICLNEQSTRTWWSIFNSKCPITTDGKRNDYTVSIAYKMREGKGSYSVDSSLIGKVCIYFPTDQKSSLHFHINAPFASTVARDNIQYCCENDALLDALADLVIGSLYDFKKYNMLDYAVYEALPQQRDFWDMSRYKIFLDKVYDEFLGASLFIDENGEYKKRDEIYIASTDVKKVLPMEYVVKLYSRSWIPTFQPTKRIDYFFNQFKIAEYKMENFLYSLKNNSHFFDELFEKNCSGDYCRHLYYMFSQVEDVYPTYYHSIDEILNKKSVLCDVGCFLCEDGELHSISEKLFVRTEYTPRYIKNPIYINLGSGNKERTNKIKQFLLLIGAIEMNKQVDEEAELEGAHDSDDVVIKLLEIIEDYRKHNNLEGYRDTKFILARKFGENNLSRVTAGECCWAEDVAFFYHNSDKIHYVVAKDYYQSLDASDWKDFEKVFKQLGGKLFPTIYKCEVDWRHPQYKELDTSHKRYDTEKSSNYTITGIDDLKLIEKEGLFAQSLLLWQLVVADKNLNHHIAKYRPNGSSPEQEKESSVAYWLRRIKWIPNKDGVFCRPCDITADELYEGFEYNTDAVFLNNLGFGDRAKAPDDVAVLLEKAGVSVSTTDRELLALPDDEKEKMLKAWKETKERERKKKSLSEALNDENKEQSDSEEDDEYGRNISIKDPSAREKKQWEDFEAGLEKPVFYKPVLTYTYSTKKTGIERQFVKEQYKGRCQICDCEPIRKYNGDIYFEAINIISTAHLDDSLLSRIDKGWNTLCLCPTCAAKYRYCSKNLDGFEEQIETTTVEPGKNKKIPIKITLQGNSVPIWFTPRHFIALKAAFKVYKENEE